MARSRSGSDKPYQLGPLASKIDSQLRVMANASAEVNLVRCDRTGALAAAPRARGMVNQMSRLDLIQAHLDSDPVTRGKLGAPPDAILVNVFVTSQAGLPAESLPPLGRPLSRMHVATVPLSSLRTLADHPMVMNIAMGQTLKAPQVTVSTDRPNGRPSRQSLGSSAGHRDGADVIVGVIDIGGFDFSHPDFLDGHGGTRFLSIWDMGADPHDSAPEAGVGRLITQEQMNAALAAAEKAGAPATRLEPQSAMHPGSHGTHVASIAAGNSGIAPKAGILGVLIALPQSDWDARTSFFDSTRLALAVRWLTDTARELGRPIAINISLGTNGHAHDSSVAVNRWIDMLLSEPGRCVCVAAGNAGQENSAAPGDMGDVMGRIHTSGRIAARGLDHDIRWVVVGNSQVDVSDNELELWFSAQDRLAVSLRTPAGQWLGPLEANEFVENRQLPDGSFVSIYNELYHPANGANTIAVYLKNGLGADAVNGIPAGTWTVRLHGREIRDGQFHGWIERDNPQPRGSVGPSRKLWSFPSYFAQSSNVDSHSISTLACGMRVIAVANLDTAAERISISSSQGPTRDGRQKPDVAAPGTRIVAARGFAGDDDLWVAMSGTSMASPYVCGLSALLLGVQASLTSAQIMGILQRTARPLPGADFRWRDDAGFGCVDPHAAMAEASIMNRRQDRTRE